MGLAPVPDAASGYRPIAMAGASDAQSRIGIDFDKLGKDQDLKLALMYGIDATASLIPDEGTPETGVQLFRRGRQLDTADRGAGSGRRPHRPSPMPIAISPSAIRGARRRLDALCRTAAELRGRGSSSTAAMATRRSIST